MPRPLFAMPLSAVLGVPYLRAPVRTSEAAGAVMLLLLPLVVRATGAVTIRTFVPLACLLAVPAAAGGPMRTCPHLRARMSAAATTIAMPPSPAPAPIGSAPAAPPPPTWTRPQDHGRGSGAPASLPLAPSALPPYDGLASDAAQYQHDRPWAELRQASARLQLARATHADMLTHVADLQAHLALEQRRAAEVAAELTRAEAAVAEAEGRLRPWSPPLNPPMSPAPYAAGPATHFPVFVPASQRAAFEAWMRGLEIADGEVIIVGDIISGSSAPGPADVVTSGAPA